MKDDQTTITDLKQMMKTFVAERNWQKYHLPRNLAASVSVEAGELLELFQWTTQDESVRKSMSDADFRLAVGEEMSDVLMYLMSLANAMDFDIAAAVEAKMVKNRKKYPADQFQGHYERPVKGKDEKEG